MQGVVLKRIIIAIVEYIKVRCWQLDQILAVYLFMLRLGVATEQFVDITQKTQRHIGVDGGLVFNQDNHEVVHKERNVILDVAVKAAIEGVDGNT